MPKKNLPRRVAKNNLTSLRSYSWPKLHEGKRWYVDFFAFDPVTQTKRRKKFYIEDGLKLSEKKKRGADIIKIVTDRLQSGWNPWVDEAEGRSFSEINAVLDRYIEYIEKAGRSKTKHSYNSRVNILKEYIATMPIPIRYVYQFDTSFVVGFLDYCYLDRECSARTRNNYRGWCSAFAEWLIERKYIESNPCATIAKMTETEKKRCDLTPDMLRLMNDYLNEYDRHFLLACLMEYYTFIRPTELSNLRIGDISIANQTIFVSGAISKNKRNDNVAINDTIIKLMIDLGIFSHPNDHYIFSHGFKPGEKRVGPDQFNKRWVKMRRHFKWGSEYQFYSLKDSGIRDLANEAGIVVARDQARHTDISTTNKYLRGRNKPVHEETKTFKGALGYKSNS